MTETCAQCGFDAHDYTHQDLLGTLRALAPMWRTMTEGMPADVLSAKSSPETWSAIEYAAHSRDVTEAMGRLLHFALSTDAPRIETPPPEPPTPVPAASMREAINILERDVARLHDRAAKLSDAGWERAFVVAGDELGRASCRERVFRTV